jgi:hypothetical protein
MDPEKEKALQAIRDGYEYDVNGKRCRTIAEVTAAWKDKPADGDPVEKPPKKSSKPKPVPLAVEKTVVAEPEHPQP